MQNDQTQQRPTTIEKQLLAAACGRRAGVENGFIRRGEENAGRMESACTSELVGLVGQPGRVVVLFFLRKIKLIKVNRI